MNERMTTSQINKRKLLNEFKWEEVLKRTLELLKEHNIDFILVSEEDERKDDCNE